MDREEVIGGITESSKETFRKKNAVLSYAEYLELLAAKPYTLTRNAAQYAKDLFDHHGCYEVKGLGGITRRRWRLFDDEAGDGRNALYGHEEVQQRIYRILAEFVQRGRADRLILLHGPNGSAKSTIIAALTTALEAYSRSEEGPLYRLSWIFCNQQERSPMGFGGENPLEELDTLAHVDEKMISSCIPCEVRDPPFFLIPKRRRRELLEQALEEAPEEQRRSFTWTDYLLKGDLSPKNKVIYESLLRSYGGDWKRVVRHVRVERYYISHRYRTGAVTIEPQATIDATSRVLGHPASTGLPPVLVHENLVEAGGDLVDANNGVVEYSDFLKRNMEANKYLLTTAERGFVNLPAITVPLNLVLMGTTNEKYLTAFKRDATFPSFKGRLELVRVPYLRQYGKEALIYERYLRDVGEGVTLAPHTAWVLALWAVLTRLRRPNLSHFPEEARPALKRLDPINKAFLYEAGTMPPGLDDEEQKALRNIIPDLLTEFDTRQEEFENMLEAAYEGRRGASPREMMTLISEIVVGMQDACFGPMHVFESLPRLIADRSLYSYLRVPKDEGYHDVADFIEVVRRQYIRVLAREIQKASDLVEETEYMRLFQDYLRHVKAYKTGEKVPHPQTGEAVDPDRRLMKDVEERLGITDNVEEYRRNLMGKAAAWRLTNPEQHLVVEELFSEHLTALERSFFRERRDRIFSLVEDALQILAGGGQEMVPERREAAANLMRRLQDEFGYAEGCQGAMLSYFHKHRELLEE